MVNRKKRGKKPAHLMAKEGGATFLKHYGMTKSIAHDPVIARRWQRMHQTMTQHQRRKRRLTRGFLFPKPSVFELDDTVDTNHDCRLLNALQHSLIGPLILGFIFAEGRHTVQSLALASRGIWQSIAFNTKLWDFVRRASCNKEARSRYFVAVAPEYTVGELNHASSQEAGVLEIAGFASDNESAIYSLIQLAWQEWKATRPYWRAKYDAAAAMKGVPVADQQMFPAQLIRAVRSLKDVKEVHLRNQLLSRPEDTSYSPSLSFSCVSLERMLTRIWSQRCSLEILYFCKIPLLDCRILAVILRACPRVHTLCVYDCPLIDFGNVITLLDLLWEINKEREDKGLRRIEALDFHPRYEKSTGHHTNSTYGLTWAPTSRDFALRGFYAIILKAYSKARCLKLRLLFEPHKSFTAYLLSIPNLPFGVPQFLGSAARFMQLHPKDPDYVNKRVQLYYDITAPIRVSLSETWRRDWPIWFEKNRQPDLLICTSCGYEMHREFYSDAHRTAEMRSVDKICAGCMLQSYLSRESDHMKQLKIQAIDKLFPDWDPLVFNVDCPVPTKAKGLLSLKTSLNTLPSDSEQAFGSGIGQSNSRQPVVRNHRITSDSVQNLTGLGDLVSQLADKEEELTEGHLFTAMHTACKHIDLYQRTVHLLREQYPNHEGSVKAFADTRLDKGFLDHEQEPQPEGPAGLHMFNYETALNLYMQLFPEYTKHLT